MRISSWRGLLNNDDNDDVDDWLRVIVIVILWKCPIERGTIRDLRFYMRDKRDGIIKRKPPLYMYVCNFGPIHIIAVS